MTKKERTAAVLLICIVAICLLWKTVTGFDADEQCAIVTAHRFLMGDRYMLDIFDAYQFSAMFAAPFWYISQHFFPAYPIIAFRLISTAVYIMGSIPVYRWMRRRTDSTYLSLLAALVWITALPKSILSLEHSNLAMMFITYIVLLLDAWENEHPRPVVAGVLVSALALCYPPMVITAVFLFMFMLLKRQFKAVLIYTLVCFGLAGIVFAPVVLAGGVSGLMHAVHMILLDGSHSIPLTAKLLSIKTDSNAFVHYAVRMAAYAAAAAVVVTGAELIMKKTDFTPGRYLLMLAAIPFCHIITILVLRGGSPIDYYDRYLFSLVLALVAAVLHGDSRNLLGCVYLAIAWIIAISFTNNGFFAADAYVMISVLLLAGTTGTGIKRIELSSFLTIVLMSQCACLVLCARITSTLPNSIFREDFTSWRELPFMKLERRSADFFDFTRSTAGMMESGNVVVSGYDEYAYVELDKSILAPVTISTIAYGAQWEEYFLDRMPEDLNVLVENDDIAGKDLLEILERWYIIQEIPTGYVQFDLYYLKKIQ